MPAHELLLPRRRLLTGALGAGATGALLLSGCAGDKPAPRSAVSVVDWRATRRPPYLIGHRGVGDLVPEHTLESYRAALAGGADALEISVVRSRDGVLYCQHDLTMDRTTGLHGQAAALPSSVLDTARVEVPRLGPRWTGAAAPKLPRLSEVLAAVGGKAVLCVEAKDDQAFEPMVAMIRSMGLFDSVMVKIYSKSRRVLEAQRAGFPVFNYLGNKADTTPKNIADLAARLDPSRDVLVLPARINESLTPAALLSQAVATRLPVWVFPVHRRSDVDYFSAVGVEGMIAADVPYLSSTTGSAVRDTWHEGAISPGELTKDPYNDAYALKWPGDGVITLDFKEKPSFFLPGQFCPIPFGAQNYTSTFDARYDSLPTDRTTHISIAFGHQDDRYYVHQAGTINGYHAIIRADGQIGVYAHTAGKAIGTPLGRSFAGKPMVAGTWYSLTLQVTPDRIYWTRGDGGAIQVVDGRWRGGYFHIGRSGTDGPLSLRKLQVTTS